MGWESSDVVRFDLEPLLQGKTRTAKLKRAYNSFIIDPRGLQYKPTCRILWAGNLLMSDLTFGPSFKVKRWFTGFGELSFQWIQICIGSPMHRSSLNLFIGAPSSRVCCHVYRDGEEPHHRCERTPLPPKRPDPQDTVWNRGHCGHGKRGVTST